MKKRLSPREAASFNACFMLTKGLIGSQLWPFQ